MLEKLFWCTQTIQIVPKHVWMGHSCISLSIGTNGKLLAAIGNKSPKVIGKLMIGKTLATVPMGRKLPML